MRNIALKCSVTSLALLLLLFAGGCGKKDKQEAAKLRAELAELQASSESLAGQLSKSEEELAALKEQDRRVTAERDALNSKVGAADEAEKLKKDLATQKERVQELQEQLAGLQQGRPLAAPIGKDQQLQTNKARKRLEELGALLFERGETGTALIALESVRDLGSDDAELLYRIAYCQAAAGQPDAAAASYQRALGALESKPGRDSDLLKKCLTNYGVTESRLGKPEQAVEAYKKALALDEKYTPAYFNLGLLYARELNRPADAIEALRKHIIYGGTRATSARDLIVTLQAAGAAGPEAPPSQAAPIAP